jgi:hypothetical protein
VVRELISAGRQDRARELLDDAEQLLDRASDHRDDSEARIDLAAAFAALAEAAARFGDRDRAVRLAQSAGSVTWATMDSSASRTTLTDFASALASVGRLGDAERLIRSAAFESYEIPYALGRVAAAARPADVARATALAAEAAALVNDDMYGWVRSSVAVGLFGDARDADVAGVFGR